MQNQSPLARLKLSRRFWLTILDLVISVSLHFAGRIVPEYSSDVNYLIIAIQPVFITIIAAYTVDDVTALKVGGGKG